MVSPVYEPVRWAMTRDGKMRYSTADHRAVLQPSNGVPFGGMLKRTFLTCLSSYHRVRLVYKVSAGGDFILQSTLANPPLMLKEFFGYCSRMPRGFLPRHFVLSIYRGDGRPTMPLYHL